MESIEIKKENYAIVFNVNLIRATLNEASEFKDCLTEAITDSDKDIIVNLSACEHLDSTFLGVLVSSYKKLKSQSRSLVIIEPIDQSSIFLTLNSIGKIFPLYTSVKVALEDIENKRLLEREINEISQDKTVVDSKPEDTVVENSNTDKLNDEAHTFEPQLETNFEVEEKVSEEVSSPELEAEPIEAGFNLVEHVEPENGHDSTFTFSSEEVSEEKANVFDTRMQNEEEANDVNDEKEVSEVESSPFSENVKWEFGFSS